MIYPVPLIKPNGDRGIRIAFGDERTLAVNRLVRNLSRILHERTLKGVTDILPTYAALTVMYDPLVVDYSDLKREIELLLSQSELSDMPAETSRLLIVPVCYDGEYAQDMEYICQFTGLSKEQIVALHTSEPYYVFQLGFTPGCPFIGPLQEPLHVPLMEAPRTDTPQGSVAISVGQTVIYPRATPGGMRIIGRTPVRLFQVDHPELTLFKPGDRVSFRAIDPAEYRVLERKADSLLVGVEVREYDPEDE